MTFFIYSIHVFTCFFLILVVLLQQGKGADLSVFGGGGTQTAFGARGAASLLHKLTVGGFILFIGTTLGIGVLQSKESSASVMTDVVAEEVVEEEAPAALPEAEAPGMSPTEGDAAGAGSTDGTPAEGDATEGDAGASEAGDGSGEAAAETTDG